MGVGSAIRAGLKFARRNDYSYVVQVDGDGQHNPEYIVKLLEKLKAGNDYVIGSRFGVEFTYAAGRIRVLVLRLISKIMSRICNLEISDATSGFRAFNSIAIDKLCDKFPSYYLGDTLEVLIIATSLNLKVAEVEVPMNPRYAGTPSHNPLQIALQLTKAIYVIILALVNRKTAIRNGRHL